MALAVARGWKNVDGLKSWDELQRALNDLASYVCDDRVQDRSRYLRLLQEDPGELARRIREKAGL